MRHNRYIEAFFYKRTGAGRTPVTDLGLKASYDGSERQNHLPLDMRCTINKSITSITDSASLQISNALEIETIYENKKAFFEGFSKNNYELEIWTGYHDDSSLREVVFTGDITGVNISGDSLTDQTLSFNASAGFDTYRHGVVRHQFDAGATYREIIKYIFDAIWQEKFGIELKDENIRDPEGLLETEKLRSYTIDRPGERILSDFSRGINSKDYPEHFGFVWGIGSMYGGYRQAYFIDKREHFDLKGDNTERFLDYTTGRIGRVSYGMTTFSFDHFPDTKLDIGNLIETRDYPSMNSGEGFKGRINAINMSLSNKGDNRYRVTCNYIADDGLAILNANQIASASQSSGSG